MNRASSRFLSKQSPVTAQAAASAALPAVVAPSRAALRQETADSFGYVVLALAAGEAADVRSPGRSIYIHRLLVNNGSVASSTPVITLSPEQHGSIPVFQAPSRFDNLHPFSTVRIKNETVQTVIVAGWFGQGDNLLIPPSIDDQTLVAGRSLAAVQSTIFVRPADTTAYTIGDAVSTLAGFTNSIVGVARLNSQGIPVNSGVTIKRVRLEKSTTVVTNAFFRLHFFQGAPSGGIPIDNAPWAPVFTDAGYQGAIDIPSMTAEGGTSGAFGEAQNLDIPMKTSGFGSLTLIITAEAAYVPGNAENFLAKIWGDQY